MTAELTPFQLSRVYAAGWSAGMACALDNAGETVAQGQKLNPHHSGAAQTRWMDGFSDAVRRRDGAPEPRQKPESANN